MANSFQREVALENTEFQKCSENTENVLRNKLFPGNFAENTSFLNPKIFPKNSRQIINKIFKS